MTLTRVDLVAMAASQSRLVGASVNHGHVPLKTPLGEFLAAELAWHFEQVGPFMDVCYVMDQGVLVSGLVVTLLALESVSRPVDYILVVV